ncbi:conserved hypothetical protein [Cupriavidus necator]|uniref:Permuted papain-like amidase YaeF/Yiix C92 family enzyme n=1 Tax=Cupriavidus necator TaxID=106590 RepID=A0A1K0IPV5_CUPNE|nr:conserved hypothetical protein [Cupriavidus necator]
MTMKTVRLFFSTTRWPLSAAIRAATWSRWSHVALVDGETVIEAVAVHGVRRAPLAEAIARAASFAFVDLPARDPAAVLAAGAAQINKPYDYTALIGLALRRDWQARDAWFCSELVAWSFEAAGQPLLRSEVVRRVTPQHLWMLPPMQQMALAVTP